MCTGLKNVDFNVIAESKYIPSFSLKCAHGHFKMLDPM